MDRRFRVAVIGATGLIGETLITVLEERDFPVSQLHALASERSLGRSVSLRGRRYPVQELADFDFAQCDFALFCAGAQVSREYVPRAVAAGCLVIDSSSEFSYQEDVPLVVPEVNPHALAGVGTRGIVANPSCCTIQMVLVLKPLYDAAGIEGIEVATYQSVSGAGRAALEELARQSTDALSGKGLAADAGIGQIAFNCVPHIDSFQDNGYTREEMKLVWETRKILGDAALRVNATAVQVPVFYGHSEAVHIQTRRPLSAEQARELLRKAPGVTVMDERRAGGYPTAATEAAKRDTVYVGRIREYLAPDRGLNLWIVADNVRKGAATNSVQIAEALAQRPI
ncbi:MAG TPA: aspartate-semialdehyde dehydrogenase [Steroidobacteraceae bacterium]|nr:aspartate-semialdehyde dehydrogenase [Steroidobacteraceae bacterium]